MSADPSNLTQDIGRLLSNEANQLILKCQNAKVQIQDEFGYPPGGAESLFLDKVNDYGEGEPIFRIDSIPFFFRNATLDDIVAIYPSEIDPQLYDCVTIRSSGSSLVRIIYRDLDYEKQIESFIKKHSLRCERYPAMRMIAVSIPKDFDYGVFDAWSNGIEAVGGANFEEAILRHKW